MSTVSSPVFERDGLEARLVDLMREAVFQFKSGGGHTIDATVEVGGSLFHIHVVTTLLSTPNAGSNPDTKH